MAPEKKEESKRISIEDLIALPVQFLGTPGRSSEKIAFVSNRTGKIELHLLDYKTGEFSQLTHGDAYPISPIGLHKWAPDDSYIVFPKDPVPGNEKNNIFKITISDGEVTQLTDTPEFRDDVGEVSPDGTYIVFTSDRSNGITQVFRMNPDGSEAIQLTEHERPVSFWSNPIVSPDSEWIVYGANESDDLQNVDIWIMKKDGSERKKLFGIRDGSKDLAVAWSNDGSMILIGSDHAGIEQVGIYYMKSGDVKWFGNTQAPETPVKFTADGKKIIAGRDIDAEQKLLLYDIEVGDERSLDIPSGYSGAVYTTYDGHYLLVGHQDSVHRMRFLLYDLEKHTFDEVIPAEYGSYAPEDFFPDEYISYPSGDITIHAILYKPKHIVSGTKLPAIVVPHGGPTSHYIRTFYEDAQVLAGEGYVLLYPNVRGSTGYGVEFRDACLNDWGGKDLDDIEAGVEYLQGLEYVDPKRIGIYGGSYGGYMTFMAVTKKPNLWKAGTAWMGISSLPLLYEKSKETYPALHYYIEEQMGMPENKDVKELWEDRSALNFAENMTAKLQMIHAENDPRCPIEQSEVFRNRLIELGRKEGEDFEYVRLTEEGHGSLDTDQRVRLMRYLLDFFKRNL